MRISEINELQSFQEVQDIDDFVLSAAPALMHCQVFPPSKTIMHAPEQCAPLSQPGTVAPPWYQTKMNIHFGQINLFRAKDMFFLPRFGVLISQDGELLSMSFQEAKYFTPDGSKLPHMRKSEGGVFFEPPSNLRKVSFGFVCLPWGALNNYGHFVLDGLPGLYLLSRLQNQASPFELNLPIKWPDKRSQIRLAEYRFCVPPLQRWQRRHLELIHIEETLMNLTDEVILIEDVIFTDTMAHFLFRSNSILLNLRDEQRRTLGSVHTKGDCKQIYLFRNDRDKRHFISELELVTRLAELGFDIVAPETLSVDEQIELFSQSDMIVGPTGAAFANIIYCPPGAKVVEIHPSEFAGVWVRNTCAIANLRWLPYFVNLLDPSHNVQLEEKQNRTISFDVNVDNIIFFLDALRKHF